MKKVCCINMRALFFYLLLIMIFSVAACSESSQEVVELKRFPVDSLDGIITQTGIGFDKEISSDRKGSLRITVAEPIVIRLIEISDISVENARCTRQKSVLKIFRVRCSLRCGVTFQAKESSFREVSSLRFQVQLSGQA